MAMVMTQVYLDASRKKLLAAKAKKTGRTLSELLRDAGETALLGVTSAEVLQLDTATRRAEADLKEIVRVLDADAKGHSTFLAALKKMRVQEAAA